MREKRLNLLEENEFDRGDEGRIFESLDSNIHSDFHDVISVFRERGESINVWEVLGERSTDFQKAVEILSQKSKNGNSLKAVSKHIGLESRAYELFTTEADVIKEYQEYEESSLLAKLICQDKEFRSVYTIWRWSQDGAIRDPKGFSDLSKEYTDLLSVRNLRSDSGRKAGINNEYGVDMDSPKTDLDQQLIDKVYRVGFSLIRCGKLDEAESIMLSVGLPTLAAPLHTYQFLVDPHFSPIDPNSPDQFSSKSLLFSKTVRRIVNEKKGSTFYRMYMGAIVGLLDPILSMATRTEDRLWSYSNAALFNKLYEACCGIAIDDVPVSSGSIFGEILTADKSPYVFVYDFLLRREWADIITWMAETVRKNPKIDDQLLRLFANLVAIIKIQQNEHSLEEAEVVIQMYIERLTGKGLFSLIPLYATFLTRPDADQKLLDIMRVIRGDTNRKCYLTAIDQAGFSRDDLVILSAERRDNILSSDLIDNLRWLILNSDRTLPQLVEQTNFLLRHFIERGDLDSARAVLINTNEIDLPNILTRVNAKDASSKFLSDIRECNCHHLFLETHSTCEKLADLAVKLNNYRAHNIQKKISSDDASDWKNVDLVQSTGRALEENQKKIEMRRRLANVDIYKQKALEAVEKLLKHEGWKISADQSDCTDQLRRLRNSCCAAILKLIISSLNSVCDPQGIVEIAVLIADDSMEIESTLSKDNIRDILTSMHKWAGHLLM